MSTPSPQRCWWRSKTGCEPLSGQTADLSLGITMSVSTLRRRVSMPSDAWLPRRRPSKVNGYVTTPTVRMFCRNSRIIVSHQCN